MSGQIALQRLDYEGAHIGKSFVYPPMLGLGPQFRGHVAHKMIIPLGMTLPIHATGNCRDRDALALSPQPLHLDADVLSASGPAENYPAHPNTALDLVATCGANHVTPSSPLHKLGCLRRHHHSLALSAMPRMIRRCRVLRHSRLSSRPSFQSPGTQTVAWGIRWGECVSSTRRDNLGTPHLQGGKAYHCGYSRSCDPYQSHTQVSGNCNRSAPTRACRSSRQTPPATPRPGSSPWLRPWHRWLLGTVVLAESNPLSLLSLLSMLSKISQIAAYGKGGGRGVLMQFSVPQCYTPPERGGVKICRELSKLGRLSGTSRRFSRCSNGLVSGAWGWESCQACLLLANDGRPVHQAQLLLQSTVFSRYNLAAKIKRFVEGLDPEIAAFVVDDMEDADQFADVEQRRPVKRERCIQDVKAANTAKGCRPAGDGSRQCPNPWAVCAKVK